MQLSLPIHIETRSFILGAPIEDVYFMKIAGAPHKIEVVGGTFQGEEFVYLIELHQRIHHAKLYCGSTNDMERRNRDHQRKHPLFRLTPQNLLDLASTLDPDLIAALTTLTNRTFRRYHTFFQALQRCLGKEQAQQHKFIIFHHAKKHNTNGLVMAANRRGIKWHFARILQANRNLEFAMKRQKHLSRFLPPDDMPF